MTSNIVVLNRDLLASPAFRSLNRVSILVYLDFLGKRKIHKIGKHKAVTILNNGELTYYYSEAEKKCISRVQFRNAIDELIKKGFLDLTHQGQGYRKDPSLYFLSDRWRAWGTGVFIKKERPKDTRQGKGFALIWKEKEKAKVSIEINTCSSIETNTCKEKPLKAAKSIQQATS